MIRLSALLLLAIVLSSCAVTESHYDDQELGLVYYLPRTLLNITVTKTDKAFAISAKEKRVADLSQRLVLKYRPNGFFDDRICTSVGTDNLLESIEVATDDRTPEILVSLARLSGRLAASPFNNQVAPETSAASDTFSMVIDPLNPTDIAAFNYAASDHFYPPHGAKTARQNAFSLQIPDLEYLSLGTDQICEQNEICYRTAASVPIYLKSEYATASTDVSVVSQRHLGQISVRRAFLVEKISKFRFDKGVLQAAAIKKPSEVLEAVRLPLTIIDAVLAGLLAAPANAIGQALSGLSADEKLTLISQLSENAKTIKTLETDLREFRDNGITPLTDSSITFTCTLGGSSKKPS